MQLRLDGKVALVTGGFGGLGAGFARHLGRAGAAVGVVGRRLEEGKTFVEQLAAEGIRACAARMDVSDRASVAAAYEEVSAALGTVSILVNNAGVAVTKPVLEQSEEDWQSVVEVNLSGAWRVAQVAAQRMSAAGARGSIINIASILGLRTAKQVPAYAASKAGVIHLTSAMALELAACGIRVNAIAPGYVETAINRAFFESDAGQALVRRIPQRRLGRLDDLEGPLLLLASEASAFMTGATVVVDGGHSINSL